MKKNFVCKGLIFNLILGLFLLISHISIAQKFVIPVLPDTQGEVGGMTEMFTSQLNWIVSQKDSLNIPIVLHVGDIVNFDNIGHWENADKGFKIDSKAIRPIIFL